MATEIVQAIQKKTNSKSENQFQSYKCSVHNKKKLKSSRTFCQQKNTSSVTIMMPVLVKIRREHRIQKAYQNLKKENQ